MSDALTVRFTKGDLVSGKIMDAGWKLALLADIFEDVSKTGKEGFVADFRIVSPTKYTDVEVRCWYYDKMGMAALSRMLSAVTGVEVKDNVDYNVKSVVGKQLKIYTEQKANPSSGAPMNQVNDYTSVNDERATVRD